MFDSFPENTFRYFNSRMSRKVHSNSIREVSPMARRRDDLSTAMEELNASLDSGIMHDALEDESPRWSSSRDDPNAVLIKCRSVIDDLQYELEQERRRSLELEGLVSSLHTEIESEKEKNRQDRSMVEKLRREKNSIFTECGSQITELESQVKSLTDQISGKDRELENVTIYCEKRVSELKRAVKEASTVVATPPIPVDDSMVHELKAQLSSSSAAIQAKDEECRTVVESYEKQVRMLRQQLKSSEDIIEKFIRKRPSTVPPPMLDVGNTDAVRVKGERLINPFTIFN